MFVQGYPLNAFENLPVELQLEILQHTTNSLELYGMSQISSRLEGVTNDWSIAKFYALRNNIPFTYSIDARSIIEGRVSRNVKDLQFLKTDLSKIHLSLLLHLHGLSLLTQRQRVIDKAKVYTVINNSIPADLRISDPPQFEPEKPYGLKQINELDNQLNAWFEENEAGMAQIHSINLQGLQLVYLPETIGRLPLGSLYLNFNLLTELPTSISDLQSLVELEMSYNKFTKLPTSLCTLTNLRYLSASSNQLTTVPDEIVNLTYLLNFDLRNNQLTEEPSQIDELNRIVARVGSSVLIYGNPYNSIGYRDLFSPKYPLSIRAKVIFRKMTHDVKFQATAGVISAVALYYFGASFI